MHQKGQDRAIPTFDPKKGVKQFTLTRPGIKAQRSFTEAPPEVTEALKVQPSIGKFIKEGLSGVLDNPMKEADIEYNFGAGSAKWLRENLKDLTPEESYMLYDMFNNYLEHRPLEGKRIPNDPNRMQIRTMGPITGRRS